MAKPIDPASLERYREYVRKHEKKPTLESKAIATLLDEVERLTPPRSDEPERELTIDAGLRWLTRWDGVDLARWPHSVRLLLIFANAIEWHRGQREKAIEEMGRLVRDASAMKESVKVSLELMTITKEP